MSKNKGKKAVAAPTVEAPAGAAGTTAQAAKVLHLEVATGKKYRGARDAWYTRLQEYHGKDVASFLTSAKENPPSLPKNGVAEAPQGWLSWFVRQGVAKLVPATA